MELSALWSWVGRIRAQRRLDRELAIYYHSAYAAPGLRASSRVPNIDPLRGEHVISVLAEEGLLRPGDVRAPPLATTEELARFHTGNYLAASADPEVLGRIFGINAEELDADPLLIAQRSAAGGTIAAAKLVIAGERRIAVNLGGGFHHAEPDRGSGFCVYNDVGAAIAALRHDGFSGRAAIVDLDFHQGNGNLVAFAGDARVLTYSIHGSVWAHLAGPTAKNARELQLSPGTGDRAYLDVLRASLASALEAHRAELVFYIAGNDVLAGDRLGTFQLSAEGVLERDRHVLEVVEAIDARLVITLGGGYSAGAWASTANLLRYLLSGEERALPSRPSLREHFDRIARELDPHELSRDDGEALGPLLTSADLDALFSHQATAHRVLDFYSPQGIELAFERYGISAKIRSRGYLDLAMEVDARDPAHQVVRLRGRRPPGGERVLLVELVVAKTRRTVEGAELTLLAVEWLLLQDPEAEFTLERPRLPGQEYPGLGIAEEIQELLVQACKRLGFDGLLDHPSHYHSAFVGKDIFHFLDPRDEGRFLAIVQAASKLSVVDTTRAVEEGQIELAGGDKIPWSAADHLLPLSERLREYFSSANYLAARDAELARLVSAGIHVAI